jgi:hypothetical protein
MEHVYIQWEIRICTVLVLSCFWNVYSCLYRRMLVIPHVEISGWEECDNRSVKFLYEPLEFSLFVYPTFYKCLPQPDSILREDSTIIIQRFLHISRPNCKNKTLRAFPRSSSTPREK